MTVRLSRGLFPTPNMTKHQKIKVMKARQKALSECAIALLENGGYVFGRSLKIPGAYSYQAVRDRKPIKIGIKTSADRWVGVPRSAATSRGVLGAVDRLFIATFDDPQNPTRFQVIAYDPQTVMAMAEKVYAKARQQNQSGLRWIPIDDQPNKDTTSMAAGPLGPHGTIAFDELIIWDEGGAPEPDMSVSPNGPVGPISPESTQVGVSPLRLTIPQAKAALALTLGVSPDMIRISFEG